MDIRFVTKTIHAYLDYPVAIALIALPFLLGLGGSNPLALWLSVGTGIAALILTVLTDHQTGSRASPGLFICTWRLILPLVLCFSSRRSSSVLLESMRHFTG